MGIEGLEHLFNDPEPVENVTRMVKGGKVHLVFEGKFIGQGIVKEDGSIEAELNSEGDKLIPPLPMSVSFADETFVERDIEDIPSTFLRDPLA